MNTALSIIDAFTPNTDIDYRQEMNVIHEIVVECEKEIAFMHQVAPFIATMTWLPIVIALRFRSYVFIVFSFHMGQIRFQKLPFSMYMRFAKYQFPKQIVFTS